MANLLKFFRVEALPTTGVIGGLYFVHGGEIAAGNGKLYVCTAANTFELYSGANASELTTKLNDYVLKTQKIAGVDLQDDITAEELKTALGLGSAAYTEATAYDVAGAADTVKTELVNGETEFADFKAVGDELRALDLAAAAKVADVTVGGASVVNADKVAVLGTAAGKAIEDFDAAGAAEAVKTWVEEQEYVTASIIDGLATEKSVAKAVKDAKDSLLGGAQTLTDFAKVETAIAEAEAAAKAAASVVVEGTDEGNNLTIVPTTDENGATTYTVNLSNVASAAKVATLIGEDADKSVRTIANEELAKQLIAEGAAESLDTLQEIAQWIQKHPGDAAAMNGAIAQLQKDVDAIEADYLTESDKQALTGAIATAKTEAIDAASKNTAAAIALLDATVGSQNVAKGKHVAVEVVETAGKLTGLTIVESDIASAAALATLDAEVQEHEEVVAATLNDLNERINAVDGRIPTELGVMSVAKGTDGNFVTTTVDNTDAANPKVSVAVDYVDGATAGDKLTTNTYVDEHIAAAINAIPAAHVTDVVGDSASYSVVEAPEAGGVHTVKNTLATITVDDDNKATVTEGLATDSFVKTYVENQLSWASF